MITIPSHWKEEDYSPEAAQREIYELVVKAGRRCAYDLKHCSSMIPVSETIADEPMRDFFHHRARHWLDIFYMEDGGKNYRHKLHNVIDVQDILIEQYRALIKKHGLEKENDFDEEIPF